MGTEASTQCDARRIKLADRGEHAVRCRGRYKIKKGMEAFLVF